MMNQTDDQGCERMSRCPACGYQAATVWVHGHGQCGRCGVNIDPCCGGAAFDVGEEPIRRTKLNEANHQ